MKKLDPKLVSKEINQTAYYAPMSLTRNERDKT